MGIFSGLVLSAAFDKAMRTMPISNVASAWGMATMAGIVGGGRLLSTRAVGCHALHLPGLSKQTSLPSVGRLADHDEVVSIRAMQQTRPLSSLGTLGRRRVASGVLLLGLVLISTTRSCVKDASRPERSQAVEKRGLLQVVPRRGHSGETAL